MIYRLWSSDPRFKTIEFSPGLNILLAEQHESATETDTRNGVGKSSLVALLHFLLGGNAGPKSIFRSDALLGTTFHLDFDLSRTRGTVSRAGTDTSRVEISASLATGAPAKDLPLGDDFTTVVSLKDWNALLRRTWYSLDGDIGPSCRSLLSYAMRRVDDGGFNDPFKHTYQQTPGDYQTAISFLLDLDWRLAASWEEVRQREKTVKALSSALKEGRLGTYSVSSVAKLRTEVALAETRVGDLRANVESFQVVDSFDELQREATELTLRMKRLSDENEIDRVLIGQLRQSYEVEAPPSTEMLEEMYANAGVQLGGLLRRRFEEVADFHRSLVENRERHLEAELRQASQRIERRDIERRELDNRRSQIMRVLGAGGALSQLTAMQEELGREQAKLEDLRNRYRIATELEAGKAGVRQAREELLVRLQRDQHDRESQLADIIRTFEEYSARLYEERVGSLQIGASINGPTFRVEIESGKSRGINNMQVFCFDLLVSKTLAERGLGPGFLVHDSHIFDGVDERQIGRGLALAQEIAEQHEFQYLVTMNSDDQPSILPDGFALKDYVLPVRLTDAYEEGGLFGFRF